MFLKVIVATLLRLESRGQGGCREGRWEDVAVTQVRDVTRVVRDGCSLDRFGSRGQSDLLV